MGVLAWPYGGICAKNKAKAARCTTTPRPLDIGTCTRGHDMPVAANIRTNHVLSSRTIVNALGDAK